MQQAKQYGNWFLPGILLCALGFFAFRPWVSSATENPGRETPPEASAPQKRDGTRAAKPAKTSTRVVTEESDEADMTDEKVTAPVRYRSSTENNAPLRSETQNTRDKQILELQKALDQLKKTQADEPKKSRTAPVRERLAEDAPRSKTASSRKEARLQMPEGTFIREIDASPYVIGTTKLTFKDDMVYSSYVLSVMGFELAFSTEAEISMTKTGTIFGCITSVTLDRWEIPESDEIPKELKLVAPALFALEPVFNQVLLDLPFSYQFRMQKDRLILTNFHIFSICGPAILPPLMAMGGGELGFVAAFMSGVGSALEGSYYIEKVSEEREKVKPNKPSKPKKTRPIFLEKSSEDKKGFSLEDLLQGNWNSNNRRAPSVMPEVSVGTSIGAVIAAATGHSIGTAEPANIPPSPNEKDSDPSVPNACPICPPKMNDQAKDLKTVMPGMVATPSMLPTTMPTAMSPALPPSSNNDAEKAKIPATSIQPVSTKQSSDMPLLPN